MALTQNTVGQAESVCNIATFTVATDATAAVKTFFHCGFVPRRIKFINLTDRIQDEFIAGMAADTALHTVAAGTVTLAASGGITVESNTRVTTALSVVMPDGTFVLKPASGQEQYVTGFSVPAALMLASKTFVVVAEG